MLVRGRSYLPHTSLPPTALLHNRSASTLAIGHIVCLDVTDIAPTTFDYTAVIRPTTAQLKHGVFGVVIELMGVGNGAVGSLVRVLLYGDAWVLLNENAYLGAPFCATDGSFGGQGAASGAKYIGRSKQTGTGLKRCYFDGRGIGFVEDSSETMFSSNSPRGLPMYQDLRTNQVEVLAQQGGLWRCSTRAVGATVLNPEYLNVYYRTMVSATYGGGDVPAVDTVLTGTGWTARVHTITGGASGSMTLSLYTGTVVADTSMTHNSGALTLTGIVITPADVGKITNYSTTGSSASGGYKAPRAGATGSFLNCVGVGQDTTNNSLWPLLPGYYNRGFRIPKGGWTEGAKLEIEMMGVFNNTASYVTGTYTAMVGHVAIGMVLTGAATGWTGRVIALNTSATTFAVSVLTGVAAAEDMMYGATEGLTTVALDANQAGKVPITLNVVLAIGHNIYAFTNLISGTPSLNHQSNFVSPPIPGTTSAEQPIRLQLDAVSVRKTDRTQGQVAFLTGQWNTSIFGDSGMWSSSVYRGTDRVGAVSGLSMGYDSEDGEDSTLKRDEKHGSVWIGLGDDDVAEGVCYVNIHSFQVRLIRGTR